MFSPLGSAQRLGPLLLIAASWLTLTTALNFNICASINTGSTPKNESIYQTNGLCHDFCFDDYAYAITQENSCWCSNYAPDNADTLASGKCSYTCPAFPSERCGGPGAFAYIALGNVAPSGTQGAPAASSTTSSQSTTESKTESKTESTTAAPSSTTSKIRTVTADGTVKTVTVDATATVVPTVSPTSGTDTASGDVAGSDNGHSSGSGGSKGLSTGSVVGIVVGVIGAVLAAAGLALFFFFRRRKQNKEQAYQEDPSVRGSSSHRPDMSMSGSGGAPASPNSAGNRSSMLQIDPRMDPFKQGLYMRSVSHESINTLRDDHDYSRRIHPPKVLRATNPDPEAEN